MHLSVLPNDLLIIIIKYIGNPEEFLCLFQVCHDWNNRFNHQDGQLWMQIALSYHITIHSLTNIKDCSLSLRSRKDYRKLFLNSYYKKISDIKEKHDQLIIQANFILQSKRDQPSKLKKLIEKLFPNIEWFNCDYKCQTMEDNSLLTLSCRYNQSKCMMMLIEIYHANIDICDIGGFTPLMLCTYQGSFSNVLYLLKKGSNWKLRGRLRSGSLLTAEHWAAILGHMEIFRYLHAMRIHINRTKYLNYSTSNRLLNTTTAIDSSINNIELVLNTSNPLCTSYSTLCTTPRLASISQIDSNIDRNQHNHSQEETYIPIKLDFQPQNQLLYSELYYPLIEEFMNEINHVDNININRNDSSNSSSSSSSEMISCDRNHALLFNQFRKSTEYSGVNNLHNSNSSSNDVTNDSNMKNTNINTIKSNSNVTNSNATNTTNADNNALPNDNMSFCICGKGFIGQMVACDGRDCPIEWFHYNCVGLYTRPHGRWYCPTCLMDVEYHSNNSTIIKTNTMKTTVAKEYDEKEDHHYCICNRNCLDTPMVACDNDKCLIEWYHFECVGLENEPISNWICPACSNTKFDQPIVKSNNSDLHLMNLSRMKKKYKKRLGIK